MPEQTSRKIWLTPEACWYQDLASSYSQRFQYKALHPLLLVSQIAIQTPDSKAAS